LKQKSELIQSPVAPTSKNIDLLKAKDNSIITFTKTTAFAFTNSSSFYPIYFDGKNVTITSEPGAVIAGSGSLFWDGLESNGGVKVSDGCKYQNRNTANISKSNHFIWVKIAEDWVIRDLHLQNWPAHGFSIGSSSDRTIKDIVMDNSAGDAPSNRSNGKAAAHNSDGAGRGKQEQKCSAI